MITTSRSKPWNTGRSYSFTHRLRVWTQVRRLADKYGLPLVDCIKYMVPSVDEQAVLVLRGLEPRWSYERIAAARGQQLEGIEMLETRGLLHLLSRLCEYDERLGAQATDGEPIGSERGES